MTRRTSELETAYRRARYRVAAGDPGIELQVDVPSSAAAALLELHRVSGAALITAWNPGSRRVAAAENEQAQRALEAAVATAGLHWLPGAGLDPAGAWPDEPGLLILGIERQRAAALARRFGQAAFLWLDAGGVPALIWT